MSTLTRIALVAVAILMMMGCGRAPEAKNDDPRPVLDREKDRPTIMLTSEQFYKEYKDNKEATTKKYQGAAIVISGTVVAVSPDSDGKGYVCVNAAPMKISPRVTCMVPEDPEPWGHYSPGQTIKLRGFYQGSSQQMRVG